MTTRAQGKWNTPSKFTDISVAAALSKIMALKGSLTTVHSLEGKLMFCRFEFHFRS